MSRGRPTVCEQMIYTQVTPFRDWAKQIAREAAGRAGIPLVGWVAAETVVDAGTKDAGAPDVSIPALGVITQPRGGGCSSAGGQLSLLVCSLVALLRRGRRSSDRVAS